MSTTREQRYDEFTKRPDDLIKCEDCKSGVLHQHCSDWASFMTNLELEQVEAAARRRLVTHLGYDLKGSIEELKARMKEAWDYGVEEVLKERAERQVQTERRAAVDAEFKRLRALGAGGTK